MAAFFAQFLQFVACFSIAALPAGQSRSFRVSAVQESQVWIEGGLLDGLEEGMEGDVYYEITIAGQKKRIVPAKARLYTVHDRYSVATLREQTGIVNVGGNVSLVPKAASDLLTLFNARALEAFSSKDYSLAKAYYGRILEALPGDPFATQKIRDCDTQLEKLAALARERRNVPYYKQVIQTSLDSKDPESARLALSYIDKILAVLPGDAETMAFKTRLEKNLAIPAAARVAQSGSGAGDSAVTKSEPEKKASVAAAEPPAPGPQPPIPIRATVEPPPLLKDMLLIPEGDYSIGSSLERSPFANEGPKQQIHLQSFHIEKYEVTNEDYKRFCDATGRGYPGYFQDDKIPERLARRPVVMVSWIDADAYCRWAGRRLPTELEWEAAAAGASGRTWPWGDMWEPGLAATRESGETEASEVGTHPGDVSSFGVYDMAGNVSEWTSDWYKPYSGNSRKEKEYGEQFKVLRGGSVKASKDFARSQFRARLPDGFRSADLGFRCAVSKKVGSRQ